MKVFCGVKQTHKQPPESATVKLLVTGNFYNTNATPNNGRGQRL